MSLIGTIIGLTALAIPASMWMIAHRVPPIHDITTDTENPPKFVAVVKLRHDASNPVEYGDNRLQSCNVWHILTLDHL
jgi:hypothetical protein